MKTIDGITLIENDWDYVLLEDNPKWIETLIQLDKEFEEKALEDWLQSRLEMWS